METDQSYSGESNSSSGSSSESSDGEGELLESVKVLGQTIQLPQDLCEDYGIFKEFFSVRAWEALDDKHKEHLKTFLPKFTENNEEEQDKTLKMLFNREVFHFSSPLNDFYNNLRQGNYRPDIAKMKKFLLKARAKQQKHKIKSYYAKLMPEVLISRERLLTAARSAPPGPEPRVPLLPPKPSTKDNYRPPHIRARQRYFEELSAIRSEVGGDESEDENYPEGPQIQPSKKRTKFGQTADGNVSGTLGGYDSLTLNSLECLKNVLAAHKTRRQYRDSHPELNTAGITLDDIKQRVALVNGTSKKLMFGGQQKSNDSAQKLRRGSKKEASKHKASEAKTKIKDENQIENVDNNPLLPNIKIKCEKEESDSESSSFLDPITSPIHKGIKTPDDIKKEVDLKYPDSSSINKFMDHNLEIKQEPQDPVPLNAKIIQPVPIKLEDLDGIDMMDLPVELADDVGEVVGPAESIHLDPDESLTETTYSNFLCLVRALFPVKSAHRASKQKLKLRCAAVMRSPIAPLNTWYHLSNDWCAELDSALGFLAGERGPHPDDFVPYLQFIQESQMYQWIGAGRDCDAILGRLCERWLRAVSPQPQSNEIPPPRYPTSWVVRPPTSAETIEFRSQERRRFASAAKPFTYIQHGYRAVVGPCARAPVSCSAHSSVLISERPRHATFLCLVRDAIARLPNGEGTKQDIVTLVKMSQYVLNNDQLLQNAVNSTLDKLIFLKRDPFVKYDQRSSIWTYLHRHKSEEDWLKSTSRSKKISTTTTVPVNDNICQVTPMDMDMDVAVEEIIENASDSDVDVEDSNEPPHLSSAQLLKQITQATQAKQIIQKAKPKQIPTQNKKQTPAKQVSPPKTKAITANKVNQSPKTSKPSPVQKVQSPKTTPKSQIKQPPKAQTPKTAIQIPPQPIPTSQSQTKLTPVQSKANVIQKQVQFSQKTNSQTTEKPNVPHLVQAKANVVAKLATSSVANTTQLKSPLIKQRPLQKAETTKNENISTPTAVRQEVVSTTPSVAQSSNVMLHQQQQQKLSQVATTRSLLLRPPSVQTTATAITPITTQVVTSRRGIVRVLSPATPSSGKSLISPRALMSPTTPTSKKRTTTIVTTSVTTVAQSSASTSVVSSIPSTATTTRTVQLAGGRTVQLAANQTVHLPSGQSVQIAGHTLQLSSLQLPTQSIRLSSGQTVQLATPQTVRTVSSASIKTPVQKTLSSQAKPGIQMSQVQIPVSTVQLAGQTVQIGGQSVQLTGHTVKLPSGQSVQVASQGVLPTQSVQLPNGQTVQLAGQNIQTLQLGQNVLTSQGHNVQLGSQVQLSGQTVQLSGQTVQLPSGQTLQLSSGQTVQLSSGQTLQLSGQTVQLASQQKTGQHVVRTQTPSDKPAQPIVAKLLTNAQGQMISLESMMGNARTLQLSNVRPQGQKTLQAVQNMSGVRVVSTGTRMGGPLILTAGKPLHNIILQQSDGNAIRVTSSGGVPSTQTLVLSNIAGQTATTSTSSAPVLKLQQVNTLQQLKISHGIKIQQPTPGATSSGVRSVLMDGQQLKLVGGRHVLARLLRPNNPQ